MAYLGIPYRLAYIGQNFRTGLTDVIAMVLKPDGSVVGPYSIPESTGLAFTGVYVYNFETSGYTDPAGEYLAQMISPSENSRSLLRFTLNHRPEGYGDPVSEIQAPQGLIGFINQENALEGFIEPEPQGPLLAEIDLSPFLDFEFPEPSTLIGEIEE